MPKINYSGSRATAAPPQLQRPLIRSTNACAGPANLSASTYPLDVRSHCSRSWQCGKGRTDFHDLSRAPPDSHVEL